MDGLEEARQRRLAELQAQQAAAQAGADPQQQVAAQQAAAEEAAAQEAAIERVLQQVLAPEARERLTRIRLSRPQLADSVTQQLVQVASSGRLQRRLTDDDLRQVLAQASGPTRDIKITRK